jgi:glycosyltransferase involved in cell wall biosynthesis
VNHIFVTQDYPPVGGGMARRYVELCRRFPEEPATTIEVSTVSAVSSADGDAFAAGAFDAGERYPINRQPFSFDKANRFANQLRWGWWLNRHCRERVDVIHCGNIRPVGYAVTWPHVRLGIPYLLYVNGGDLLRERNKARERGIKRAGARRILGGAAGIVATSRWVAELAGEVMQTIGIDNMPPVGAFDLGTDPITFHPSKDTGLLRTQWRVGQRPLMITVARLVPHKGQDSAIRVLAALREEFPELCYVMVGEGHDEQRLRDLARDLGVADRVVFAGPLGDDQLPEAYATSTLYVGLSRVDREIDVEGFGISFLEAAASGLPSVAGDSGGVRSAVRDGETGILVPPSDTASIAAAIAALLRDEPRRLAMGRAARLAVELHYNWDRVARDTRDFTSAAVGDRSLRT